MKGRVFIMAIRSRPAKKAPKGVSYQVYFEYTDKYGDKQTYIKGGFYKKRDAENHETLKKAELIQTGDIYTNSPITLDEAFDLYIESAELKKSTKQMYTGKYNTWLKPLLGKYKVSVIDNYLVQNKFNQMTTLSYGSKDIILRLLNNIIKFAVNNKMVKPVDKIKINLGENKKKVSSAITDQEFLLFLDYINSSKKIEFKKQYNLALWIGYYTGMRIGEVFALEVSDIDFTNNTININKTLNYDHFNNELYISDTKTFESMNTVPMTSQLKEIIKEYLKDHDYDILISKDGNYIKPGNLSALMVYYSRTHDTKIHFHMLRHAMATKLFENDVNPKIAQRIMRHAKIETTLGIYTHLKEDIAKDTLDEVFNAIDTKPKPVKNLSKVKNSN